MKKKTILLVAGVLLLVPVSLAAYEYFTDPARLTTDPEFTGLLRTVSGNTLSSPKGPPIRFTFDEAFHHIGGQKFTLYGTAAVEQHFFVEEHPDGTLKTIFWIQFESFLPDNNFTYDYSGSPMRTRIGDFDFYTDAEPGKSSRLLRNGWPGTDGYAARSFAADKGYVIPDHYTYARLVHLPDEARRSELLIIVMADMAPTGFTADQLREGGAHHDQWPEVQAAHLDMIQRVMRLDRID